jgi:hypothetical protein
VTVQLGFNNVIDAFHRLGSNDIAQRFFVDERREAGSIRLTDELRALGANVGVADLRSENEAR